MSKPKLVYWMTTSLDGFVETRDGNIDFSEPDAELFRFHTDYARTLGAFLHGRRMYELMSAYWPTADANPSAPEGHAEFARIWKRTPKVVFSKTLRSVVLLALTESPVTNINIFVPTTIHIPDPLLERVDTRAKTLGISRNRLILEALEEKVGARDEWAPELVRMLAEPVSSVAGKELEESLAVVRRRRSSRKGPPKL
jgi:hypothetical protein